MASPKEKVGLALLGIGRIGQIHLNLIISNPRANLIWIVEENEKFANEVLDELGLDGQFKVVQTSKLQKVLDDPRHFDPAIRSLYNNAKSGILGKLYMVKSTFRDRPLWIGAHGLSQTFLIHDADLITWFAGELPETVACQASANIKEVAEQDDVDTVAVTMKFPSGMIGIIDFCRYCPYGYDVRLEVCGSEGMQIADSEHHRGVKSYQLDSTCEAPLYHSFPDRFHEAYKAELSHFLDVIQGKAEMEVMRKSSEQVAIVIDAVQESYKTGKIVRLSKS